MMRRRRVLIAMLVASASPPLVAQDFSLHGYLDARFVAAPDSMSWTDGGLGKTRYGGGANDLRFGGAALVGSAQITPKIFALADLQAQTTDRRTLALNEAYVRYRPVSTTPWRWSIKLGEFFAPISLENGGIGWTSLWTLSPSAINTWVGEELRTFGAEARVEYRGEWQTVSAIGAAFRANDPAGELLAARGWSIGDLVYGLGSKAREPDVYGLREGRQPPTRFDPFQEIDGRTGWYGALDWRGAGAGHVNLLRYDNNADATTHSSGAESVFSWHTKFWSLGAETEIERWTLMAQAIDGTTLIAPAPSFSTDTHFRAAYVLAGLKFGAWQPALRFDAFVTNQRPRDIPDRAREHGTALTLALNWRPREWLRVTGECLRIDSTRTQRVDAGLPASTIDTQFQLNARVLF